MTPAEPDLRDLLDSIHEEDKDFAPAHPPGPPPTPVLVTLTADHVRLAVEMALLARIGGASQIGDRDRATNLTEDQLVGQFGQVALSLYWFNSIEPYKEARRQANLNRTVGDGGSDILGMNLDVKTSRMRASEDPLDYRLLVRPKERHPGNVYILGLIPKGKMQKESIQVLLVGWAAEHELPKYVSTMKPFDGAHVIMARELHPLPPISWSI